MRKMKKNVLRITILCIVIYVMTGCSYREFEDSVRTKKEEKKAEKRLEEYYENIEPAETTESTENGEEWPSSPEYIEIKTGPNEIAEDSHGEANYRIDNVRFYEHFKDNDCGITDADLANIDENVANKGFILMDVTIENISNVGWVSGSETPYINVSAITIQTRERVGADGVGWYGTYPNYFDKRVDDEENAYCIAVEQGESEKFMLGFIVPANRREELSDYVLDYSYCQRYEIPAISN